MSEAEQALLFTLRIPAIPAEGPAVLASVAVAYDAVAEGIQAREVTQDLRLGVVPAEQVAAIPADAAVLREVLVLRAARVLEAAIAQADTGDVAGALQRLKAFLALPALATARDPELCAARRRIRDSLNDLEAQGYDRHQRKQMLYSSCRWSRGKGKPSQEPTEDRA